MRVNPSEFIEVVRAGVGANVWFDDANRFHLFVLRHEGDPTHPAFPTLAEALAYWAGATMAAGADNQLVSPWEFNDLVAEYEAEEAYSNDSSRTDVYGDTDGDS